LFTSATTIAKCLQPFQLPHGFQPVVGGAGFDGYQSIDVDGNVYYTIAAGFTAEMWVPPAFALLVMLLCVLLLIRHVVLRRRASKTGTQVLELKPTSQAS
jgi:hypothetical protein